MNYVSGLVSSLRKAKDEPKSEDTSLPSSEVDPVSTVEFYGLSLDPFQCKITLALIHHALKQQLFSRNGGFDERELRDRINERVLKQLNLNTEDPVYIRNFEKGVFQSCSSSIIWKMTIAINLSTIK